MPGIFILSLDVEIAWGTFDVGGLKKYKKHFNSYRSTIDRLTQLLERYQIKATWAFVGHLFLDECQKIGGITHPDVLRPRYSWYKNDWHSCDPGTDINRDPFWYGKDVLEKVKKMSPVQEIATHTFSHAIIGDTACTEDIACSQIEKCLELAVKENIQIKSIVFPRNKVGHLDVLKKLGIRSFRGVERGFYKNFLEKVFYIFNKIFSKNSPVYSLTDLKNHDGVLEIPASMLLMSYDGLNRFIPYDRFSQVKKGLETAILGNSIFHLWFHPSDLASSEKMFEDLENILKLLKNYIDSGKIINLTMDEMVNYYNYAEPQS